MKKIALLFIATLFYVHAQAQSTKGSYQVGIGGLPIIYPNNSIETVYSLRANFGYFPVNKLSVGIMPFAGKVVDMSSIGASIYLRYYITNSRFSLFVEAGGGFGNLTYEDASQYDGVMNSFNIGPGVHYTLISKSKNKVAIEFLFQYARLKNINHPESTLTGNTLIPALRIQYFIVK